MINMSEAYHFLPIVKTKCWMRFLLRSAHANNVENLADESAGEDS